MRFSHANDVWRDFPELVPGVLVADGITADASVGPLLRAHTAAAAARLATSSEGELPEVQAWRRAFSRMGLKPTQYRSASESLLRRFRKEGALPRIHPLIDLCNAVSLAFAIPIAAFDLSRISGDLEVRRALGSEEYETFAGEVEHPAPGEVVFVDGAGRVHARRWTNRQSGYSAVRTGTSSVLVVAEAMHDSAGDDVPRLVEVVAREVESVWGTTPGRAVLSAATPGFDV